MKDLSELEQYADYSSMREIWKNEIKLSEQEMLEREEENEQKSMSMDVEDE